MTTDSDAEIDRLAGAELARRAAPPYRPDRSLIGCLGCGRRIYDDDGNNVHRWWWDWLPWRILNGCPIADLRFPMRLDGPG